VTVIPDKANFTNWNDSAPTVKDIYRKSFETYTYNEAAAAYINLVSNQFINAYKNDGTKSLNTVQYIAPMIGTDNFNNFIDSILSIIEITLFPVALSLGFPLILYNLVLEKEEKIKSLLEINGLRTTRYWGVYVLYNFILLETSSILFIAFGKLFVKQGFW
jgi:hypothetical protein